MSALTADRIRVCAIRLLLPNLAEHALPPWPPARKPSKAPQPNQLGDVKDPG